MLFLCFACKFKCKTKKQPSAEGCIYPKKVQNPWLRIQGFCWRWSFVESIILFASGGENRRGMPYSRLLGVVPAYKMNPNFWLKSKFTRYWMLFPFQEELWRLITGGNHMVWAVSPCEEPTGHYNNSLIANVSKRCDHSVSSTPFQGPALEGFPLCCLTMLLV